MGVFTYSYVTGTKQGLKHFKKAFKYFIYIYSQRILRVRVADSPLYKMYFESSTYMQWGVHGKEDHTKLE